MWSEAELRGTVLDAATVGAIVCGIVFVLDVTVTLARRLGLSCGPLGTVFERRSPAAWSADAALVMCSRRIAMSPTRR